MEGLLLDTHTFLWWAASNPQLPASIDQLIDHHPAVYLSSVVAWEVEIKQAKGKLRGQPFDWNQLIVDKQLIPLDVSFAHIITLRSLPLLHHDPFDRLLIAQAMADNLQLVTHDKAIQIYPDVDIVKV